MVRPGFLVNGAESFVFQGYSAAFPRETRRLFIEIPAKTLLKSHPVTGGLGQP